MTKQEWINQFNLLYNNIMSNQAPGLDEYEMSVFSTKAQDEILKAYFNPRLNKTQEGYDANGKRQIDFSMITRIKKYTSFSNAEFAPQSTAKKVILDKDDDIMIVINEMVTVSRTTGTTKVNKTYPVSPIPFAIFTQQISKPYFYPPHNQAWRLLYNSDSENCFELIVGANEQITDYKIRYVKKPYPIILYDLEDESINGKNKPFGNREVFEPIMIANPEYTEGSDKPEFIQKEDNGIPLYEKRVIEGDEVCELDPIIHEEILQRAVELAKAAYIGDLNTQIALGVNSATNMGIVAGGSRNE